jgi:hypothetical protein
MALPSWYWNPGSWGGAGGEGGSGGGAGSGIGSTGGGANATAKVTVRTVATSGLLVAVLMSAPCPTV